MIRSSVNTMLDKSILTEALSTVIGETVKFQSDCKDLTDEIIPLHITNLTSLALLDFNTFACKPASHLTSIQNFEKRTLPFAGDKKKSKIESPIASASASTSLRKKIFAIPDDFFDPVFDFDFTHMSESTSDYLYMRGNEPYKRPYGWMRFALKVLDKFPDGNGWLGMYGGPGEWPVSYHGTSKQGAEGIIKSHFKPGDGAVYGRGIYSTPDINVADGYSATKTFTSQWNGKTYKVVMQNRINPKQRKIFGNYWLVSISKGTSPEKEREIVESSIRPYGLLLKEVTSIDSLSVGHQ